MISVQEEIRGTQSKIITYKKCTCDTCGKLIYIEKLSDMTGLNPKYNVTGYVNYAYKVKIINNPNIYGCYDLRHACSNDCMTKVFMDYLKNVSGFNMSDKLTVERFIPE